MRSKTSVILLSAALAALPSASRAALITYQYANIKVATSLAGPYTAATSSQLSGTGAAYTLNIPVGDFVEFGLQAEVTDNNGAGLLAFNLGFNDSNGASSQVSSPSQVAGTNLTTSPGIAAVFSLAKFNGEYDGIGGILGTAPGAMAGLFDQFNTTYTQASTSANQFSDLFTHEAVDVIAAGTSQYTPIQVNSGTALMTLAPQGSTANATYTYPNPRSFTPARDTVAALPTLTIVAAVPEPASVAGVMFGVSILLQGRHKIRTIRRGQKENA